MNTTPLDDPKKKRRIRLVIALTTGIYAVMMLWLGYTWYAPQWISGFHWFDDLPEWQQMDKVAHLFWSFQVSALAARLVYWATKDEDRAAVTGAWMGFLLVSGIEVADGFSEAYGASWYDIGANALGATAFLGQRLIWKRILIWPKFSFHPTSFAPLRPEVLGNGFFEEVVKDYNGQTFWYSFRVPKMPLPPWLTFAVGVGGEGMIFGRITENEAVDFHPHRKYFFSLDINFSHLQPSSRALKALLYVTNIVKFPAPAIEISVQGIRFHPIYF